MKSDRHLSNTHAITWCTVSLPACWPALFTDQTFYVCSVETVTNVLVNWKSIHQDQSSEERLFSPSQDEYLTNLKIIYWEY